MAQHTVLHLGSQKQTRQAEQRTPGAQMCRLPVCGAAGCYRQRASHTHHPNTSKKPILPESMGPLISLKHNHILSVWGLCLIKWIKGLDSLEDCHFSDKARII